MPPLIFNMFWNPEDMDSKTREGMDLPSRARPIRQEANSPFFLYTGCQQKVWPGLKALFLSTRFELKADHLT